MLLREGRWIDRVYFVEEQDYLRQWKVVPGEDPARRALALETIEDLAESPTRLPARFADRLYRAGESGPGYSDFTLILSNGRRLAYRTGHAVDFPHWPDDVTPDLVQNALPHAASDEFRRRHPDPQESSAPHVWCLYRLPPPRWPGALAASWMALSWACAAILVDLGRAALSESDAVRILADLLRGISSPGQPGFALVLWGMAAALQAGLIIAPLVRRSALRARLGVLALMIPALALAPLLLRVGRLLWWAGIAPRAQMTLVLTLWAVPVVNAALLIVPWRRAAGAAQVEIGAPGAPLSAPSDGAGSARSAPSPGDPARLSEAPPPEAPGGIEAGKTPDLTRRA